MSNEIATYSMIYNKLNLGSTGNECPTKTLILAISDLITITNESTYGTNECVRIDDINKQETTSYTFSITVYDITIGADGGTDSILVNSYKTVNGTKINLDYLITEGLPSWATYNHSDDTFTVEPNPNTSSRLAKIWFEQEESWNTDYCIITQEGASDTPDPPTPTVVYEFSINPYKINVDYNGGSGSVTITSKKYLDGFGTKLDYNIDSSTLPSWATFDKSTSTFTIQSTTDTVGRTAKVYFTLDESGKRDYAELTQTGKTTDPTPVDTYVFTWGDGTTSNKDIDVLHDEIYEDYFDVVSTLNGSDLSWNVSDEPSWVTTSISGNVLSVTIPDNSGSARSGSIILTQAGSGNTLTISIAQEGSPSETYSWQIKKSSEPSEDAYWRQSITYDVPANTTGFSGGYSVKGRKNGLLFAEYTMSSDSPSWLTASGNSYTVQHNTSSSPRSGTLTLTQAESGLKCYIYINQSGYTPPTYEFTFANGKTYENFYSIAQGDTHIFNNLTPFISKVDGGNISYVEGDSTSGLTVSISGTTLTAKVSPNTTGQLRTLYQTWKQYDNGYTGKVITLECVQAG